MTELSEEEAEDHWSRAETQTSEEAVAAAETFREQQPALKQWIQLRSDEKFEPEVGELFAQTSALVWAAMSDAAEEMDEEIQSARVADIEEMEILNGQFLQLLSDPSALEMNFGDRFVEICEHLEHLDQEMLLKLVFEHLEDAHLERNPELDDFNFALILYYEKVIIDALNQA